MKGLKKLTRKFSKLFLVMVMLFNNFMPYMVRAEESDPLLVGKLRDPQNPEVYKDEVSVIEGNFENPGDVQVKKTVRKKLDSNGKWIEGQYEIEFEVRGKPYENTKNAYVVLVFDRSGSMICDSKIGSYSYESEYSAQGASFGKLTVTYYNRCRNGNCTGPRTYTYENGWGKDEFYFGNPTGYKAADGTTIYCSHPTLTNSGGTPTYDTNSESYVVAAGTAIPDVKASGVIKNKWESAVSGGVSFSSSIRSLIPTSYVSLVSFSSNASTATNFTQSAYTASQFGHPNGATNLKGGIDAAVAKLNTITDTNAEKFIVVISDGDPTVPDGSAKTGASSSATAAKNAGISIYTIGYQVPSSTASYATITESSDAETVLKNVASSENGTPFYYAATSAESLNPIFTQIANKIKESFAAGSNASVNDGLGSAFEVTGSSHGKEINLTTNDSFKITSDWKSVGKQTVTINQDQADENGGWKDTNTNFTFTYKDVNGETQTIDSTKDSPQVYWPQNKYSYKIRFYYEDLEGKGIYTEDTSLLKEYDEVVSFQGDDATEEVMLHLSVPFAVSNTIDINDADHLRTGYEFNASKSNITGNIKDNRQNEELNTLHVYYSLKRFSYKVNYYEKDTTTSVAPSKTVDNIYYNQEITENAIEVNGYNKYEPTEVTKNITENGVEINFYYTKRTDLSYTVNYLEKGTNTVLHEPKQQGDMTFGTVINGVDEQIPITGFTYDSADPQSITIGTDASKNVINVYYTRNNYTYTIKHVEKGNESNVLDTETGTKPFDSEVIVNEKSINGYNYDSKSSDKIIITAVNEDNIAYVYYTRRNDLSYTVNYLEKGTNTVLHTPKTVNEQTFGTKINSNNEIITITGYNFDSLDPEELTIGVNNNVINIYYTKKTDLSYTVNYLEKDTNTVLHEPKQQGNMTFGEAVNETAIDITGYVKVPPYTAEITIKETDNVINFYYEKATLGYKIEYYYEDLTSGEFVIDNNNTENLTAKFKDVISTYPDKVKAGYELDHATVPFEITATEANNVIKVYYKLKLCRYDVNYYYEGDPVIVTTPFEGLKYGLVINDYTDKPKTGYSFEKALLNNNNETPFDSNTGLSVGTDTSIDVYYVKNTYKYTIKHVEKDNVNNVLKSYPNQEAKYLDEITLTSESFDGYEFDGTTDPSNGKLVVTEKEDENIAYLYYVRRSDLSYTVNYLEKGNETNVLHEAKTVDNKTFGEVIKASDEVIEIDGYNYDSSDKDELTIGTDTKENVINLYYTRKNDLSYTVNYLEKDNETNVLHEAKTVGGKTFEDVIKASDEVIEIDGYNYDSSDKDELTIGTDATKNVINLYYTRKNDLSYTVNYLEKGNETNVLHEAKTVSGKTFEDVIKASDEVIEIDGYNYDSSDKDELTIGTDAKENVINLYYVRNNYDYTINHLDKETKEELADSDTGTAAFEEEIDVKEKDIYGYKPDSKDKDKIIISSGENIANIYYVIDNAQVKKLSYTVEYYKDGELQENDTEKVTKDIQVLKDKIPVDKDSINMTDKYVGYDYDHFEVSEPTRKVMLRAKKAPENDKLPDEVMNGTVIKVYYVMQKFSYTVKYNLEVEEGKFEVKEDATEVYNDIPYGTKVTYDVKEFDKYKFVEEFTVNGDVEIKEDGIVVELYYVLNLNDISINYVVRDVDTGKYTPFNEYAYDMDGNVIEPFKGLDLDPDNKVGFVGDVVELKGRHPEDFKFVGVYEGDKLVSDSENYSAEITDEHREFTFVYEAPAGGGEIPPQTGFDGNLGNIGVMSIVITILFGTMFMIKRKEN